MAMGASLIIHFASGRRGVAVETIVLLGIALVFAFNAALTLMQFLASEQALGAVVFWTMGSLTKATGPKVATIAAMQVPALFQVTEHNRNLYTDRASRQSPSGK